MNPAISISPTYSDLDIEEPPSRRAWLVPLLVGIAALALASLAGSTTLPWIGWSRGEVDSWIVAILPGFLLGWAAIPGRRVFPIALLTIVFTIFSVSRMGYEGFLGLIIMPPFVILCAWLGNVARRGMHAQTHGARILAALCVALAAVIGYLWFVDGWRYIYTETTTVGEVIHRDPVHFFVPSASDYRDGLSRAVSAALARGDQERARRILSNAERFALLQPQVSSPHHVAQSQVNAGADAQAEALLLRVEPDENVRKMVFIEAYLARGEPSRAIAVADTLGDGGKFTAYREIAASEAAAGHTESARSAIKELFRMADGACGLDAASPLCGRLGPQSSEGVSTVYESIAITQARSGFVDEALGTIRQRPVRNRFAAQLAVAQTAYEMRRVEDARRAFASIREWLMMTESDQDQRDRTLVDLARKQGADRLFDDADETIALIVAARHSKAAADSIAWGRESLNQIKRNAQQSNDPSAEEPR